MPCGQAPTRSATIRPMPTARCWPHSSTLASPSSLAPAAPSPMASLHRDRYGATRTAPRKFGDWTAKTNINAAYDAARPDLVLVTLGADDVQFSAVVRACVVNNLAHTFDPLVRLECTAANPGATVQTDALSHLPALERNLATLARWINQRGTADHKVPKVVFTNYFDPFPTGGTSCPDSSLLGSAQVQYLSTLLGQLNRQIIQTIGGLHLANLERGQSVVGLRRAPLVLRGPVGLRIVDHQPGRPLEPAVPGALPSDATRATTDRQCDQAGHQPIVRRRLTTDTELRAPTERRSLVHGA